MARYFIARHGETVFNASARMQGNALHTPLTRMGFVQADQMGAALAGVLGWNPLLTLWCSPAGRALQTLAIIAEHLGGDWHSARIDERLSEMAMGGWGGRLYADIHAEVGPFVDPTTLLFTRRAPGGEWYEEVAARLTAWLAEQAGEQGDRLVVMHGLSSRVLRGLLTGAPPRAECGVPVSDGLPQGSVAMIEDGQETVLHRGSGRERPAPA